jgi:hypothetical protein
MAGGTFVPEFEQAVQWASEAWDRASADWIDRPRSDFEADYWAPMTRAASVFGGQLQELAVVLDQARSEAP